MSESLLVTKLFMPPLRSRAVKRTRLLERLDEGLTRGRPLSLVSAPAGFGKTSLVGEWAAGCGRSLAWLSLDEGDKDLQRFLLYLASALMAAEPGCCADAIATLESPQPISTESILGLLVNDIDGLSRDLVLVLDDYHAVDSPEVDKAVAFFLEHPSPRLHLVIATREDPDLPLSRLRARDMLTELRAADLRFTPEEAGDFFAHSMGLVLAADEVAALESRTEGWVAGLQLAALSLEGEKEAAGFIKAFSGSHRFVLDYLAEEVFRRQSAGVQAFLLRTSILDRLCGPLCDALRGLGPTGQPGNEASGQETLEYLDRANLFIIPLDKERRWYRYHGLFLELLRQRLGKDGAAGLHVRASQWFEGEGFPVEAFRHAVQAGDLDRAERLARSPDMPIHFRGAVTAVLDWLSSLPPLVLDARPALRVLTATLTLVTGSTAGVEDNLRAAERILENAEEEGEARHLIGRIAAARATLALTRYQPDAIMAQGRRAIECLPVDDLAFRFTAVWTMAFAHYLLGDRETASRGFEEALAICEVSRSPVSTQLALCAIGEIQEGANRLHEAAQTYRQALGLFDRNSLPNACEAHLGLARMQYEWNDLDAAQAEAEEGLYFARQYDAAVDRFIPCELLLARIRLARGRAAAAAGKLDELSVAARSLGFLHRLPEIAALQVRAYLALGDVEAASRLAGSFALPMAEAQVQLARKEAEAAVAQLEMLRAQMEQRGWQAERLHVLVLLAPALDAVGRRDEALLTLRETLEVAEAAGHVRLFLDEGEPMAALLAEAATGGRMSAYAGQLLLAFAAQGESRRGATAGSAIPGSQGLIDPLSPRELEVLGLIAEGLSNQEICDRLFLALDTVKGHNRRIFDKLEVKRRTEAIARARDLGLL